MESNERIMITHVRFFAFLVLISCGIFACTNGKNTTSDVYIPSDAIVRAIEEGGDALAVCENGRDSFYVELKELSLVISSDTILAKNIANRIEMNNILSNNGLELECEFYFLKSKLENDKPKKVKQLQNCISYLNKSSIEDSIALKYYKEYISAARSSLPDSSVKYALIVDEKFRNYLTVEDFFTNKELIWTSFSQEFKLNSALEHSNALVTYMANHQTAFPALYGRSLHGLSTIYYNLYETNEAIKTIEKAVELEEIPKDDKINFLTDLSNYLINNQNFTKADSVLHELSLSSNSTIVNFRIEKLKGLKHYINFEDILSAKHYSNAIEIADQSKDISDREWLDAYVQFLKPTIALNNLNQASWAFSQISSRYNINDYKIIFGDFNLIEVKIYELKTKTQLAINSSQESKLLQALEEIDEFLLYLDYYVTQVGVENANSIYNLCRDIFDIKFLCILSLNDLHPNKKYDLLAFHENEKLKAKSIFVKKIIDSKVENDNFSKLIIDEIQVRKQIKIDKIEGLSSAYDSIVTSIKSISPFYYDFYFNSQFNFEKIVKEYCREKKLNIIEFYSGGEVFFGVLINEEGLILVEKDLANSNLAADFQEVEIFKDFKQYDSISNYHYTELFMPFEKSLVGENIKIISDGIVDFVSFDSFVSKENGRYLIEDFNISYSYSLKDLVHTSLDATNDFFSPNSIIAYSYSDTETLNSRSTNSGMKELFGAYNECLKIKEQFNTKEVQIVTGMQATKDHFLSNAGKFDIVHLALHGDGDTQSIINNKLYFRNKESKGNGDSNFLSSSDLEDFDHKIDLLFLNACETNMADRIINEGRMSIARSFAEIGVKNVITSAWEINDNSSYELVIKFYENLLSGMKISLALIDAKKSYLEKYAGTEKAHPFYWASSIYYGSD